MPESIDSRYLTEDIPMSLVPICSLSKQVGTPFRLMESITELSGRVLGKDLSQGARTLERLGMKGRNCQEILNQL